MSTNSGLQQRYLITHVDNTPVDPAARYFVLRLDYSPGCDEAHVAACRLAALEYAEHIQNHLPELAHDMRQLILSNTATARAARGGA